MLNTLKSKTHKPKRCINRTFNVGIFSLALMVIGSCAFAIDRMTNLSLTTTQRSLNGGTLPICIRTGGVRGEADVVDLPAAATVGDVYTAASQLQRVRWLSGGHFLLQHGGQTLRDHGAFIADIGICAEAAIDVVASMNDLQNLEQMILPGHCQQVWTRRTNGKYESYEQFAQHAADEGDDVHVMEVAATEVAELHYHFDGAIENKRFTSLGIDLADFDENELCRLTGFPALETLSFFNNGVADVLHLDLSALAQLKNLRVVEINSLRGLKELRFPQFDQAECKLERIEVSGCPDLDIIDVTSLNFLADNLTVDVDEHFEKKVRRGNRTTVRVLEGGLFPHSTSGAFAYYGEENEDN